MQKNQKTKDQHTVPESYLKFFIKEEQLYVLDIEKLKKGWNEFPKKRSPGNICYSSDYYTIKNEFPENDFMLKKHNSHFIEDKVLTSLENKYPDLFKQITELDEILAKEAVTLSDFITTLKLRNPYWFEKVIKKNIKNWTEKLLPQLIAEKKRQDPRAAKLPDWAFEFISDVLKKRQEDDPDYAKQFQLFSLIERFTDNRDRNNRLREKVIDCTWTLYVTPEQGPYFITTDNPGAAVGTTDQYYHTIKLDGGFIFYFPLSYRYALIITDQNKDDAFTLEAKMKKIHKLMVNGEQVNRINDVLIQVASKLLIAATPYYLTAVSQLDKPK